VKQNNKQQQASGNERCLKKYLMNEWLHCKQDEVLSDMTVLTVIEIYDHISWYPLRMVNGWKVVNTNKNLR
jgi:hypothetical protein